VKKIVSNVVTFDMYDQRWVTWVYGLVHNILQVYLDIGTINEAYIPLVCNSTDEHAIHSIYTPASQDIAGMHSKDIISLLDQKNLSRDSVDSLIEGEMRANIDFANNFNHFGMTSLCARPNASGYYSRLNTARFNNLLKQAKSIFGDKSRHFQYIKYFHRRPFDLFEGLVYMPTYTYPNPAARPIYPFKPVGMSSFHGALQVPVAAGMGIHKRHLLENPQYSTIGDSVYYILATQVGNSGYANLTIVDQLQWDTMKHSEVMEDTRKNDTLLQELYH
jgi:hypothetical protein